MTKHNKIERSTMVVMESKFCRRCGYNFTMTCPRKKKLVVKLHNKNCKGPDMSMEEHISLHISNFTSYNNMEYRDVVRGSEDDTIKDIIDKTK